MALLEILQLIGYSTAAALHFWIAALLAQSRQALGRLERVLLVLAVALGVWHASSLLVALHTMLGLSQDRWTPLLRFTDTLAVVSVTLTYSLLLHLHLHLWANARRRGLTWSERARVYLSYVPAAFLAYAAPKLWTGAYAPMTVRLSHLLLPFALWAAYVLCLVAGTDFLIARLATTRSERRLLTTLAASFLLIAALILSVYGLGVGKGTTAGLYLQTFANLGSLLPTALLAYHIYRYRYLELIFKESLILASFASVVLVVYLYGIRTVALWLTARYEFRPGAVESLMILLLALVAAPLRRWLDRRFRRLFEEEAGLFREVAARIGKSAGRYGQLPEFLRFVEERAVQSLGLRRVRILTAPVSDNDGTLTRSFNTVAVAREEGEAGRAAEVNSNGAGAGHFTAHTNVQAHYEANVPGLLKGEQRAVASAQAVQPVSEAKSGAAAQSASTSASSASAVVSSTSAAEGEIAANESQEEAAWAARVLALGDEEAGVEIEGEPLLRERGWELAYALRREERVVGLLLVDAAHEALTYEVRASLELLAGQVAIAIEDSRLVEENVRLERRAAQSERLAALGRMAATVAHEVKNPLSAIKSIAQVLREDEYIRREYARDVELIVGETDRLSQSVTQMLSFARTAPHGGEPRRVGELLESVLPLIRKDAAARGVTIKTDLASPDVELDGAAAASLRDALTNLLLNALHATPAGGRVELASAVEDGALKVTVADTGPGVPSEQRERIWEPFFTTKQRGTGLGLAIVRKRIEEAGGDARLAPQRPGEGARFVLTLPLKK
ncbi:MAG TPA: ATP-binding protein [Pyrinomonadaceae bacterium]|nr:ATP-binding protein [Pyrinomonadaceae bacterium]